MLLDQPDVLKDKFEAALPYAEFLASSAAAGAPVANWPERYAQCALDAGQTAVVGGFVRKMHVLCLTGSWCGDCALQGAAMQRVAEANPEVIDLRFLLRDEAQADLAVRAPVNGGLRDALYLVAGRRFRSRACLWRPHPQPLPRHGPQGAGRRRGAGAGARRPGADGARRGARDV